MNTKIKVLGLVFDNNDNILLIREMVKSRGAPMWNAIRGTYDNGKESITDAVKRECMEEANAKVEIKEALPYYIANYSEDKIRIYLPFICHLKNSDIKVSEEEYQDKLDEQITEIRLFSKDEFSKLNESDFVDLFVYKIISKYFN